jgi:hypothetical protein
MLNPCITDSTLLELRRFLRAWEQRGEFEKAMDEVHPLSEADDAGDKDQDQGQGHASGAGGGAAGSGHGGLECAVCCDSFACEHVVACGGEEDTHFLVALPYGWVGLVWSGLVWCGLVWFGLFSSSQ